MWCSRLIRLTCQSMAAMDWKVVASTTLTHRSELLGVGWGLVVLLRGLTWSGGNHMRLVMPPLRNQLLRNKSSYPHRVSNQGTTRHRLLIISNYELRIMNYDSHNNYNHISRYDLVVLRNRRPASLLYVYRSCVLYCQ